MFTSPAKISNLKFQIEKTGIRKAKIVNRQ